MNDPILHYAYAIDLWDAPRAGADGNMLPLVHHADYLALRAECDRLRTDADRYRWLAENGELEDYGTQLRYWVTFETEGDSAAGLDAAVDADMEG